MDLIRGGYAQRPRGHSPNTELTTSFTYPYKKQIQDSLLKKYCKHGRTCGKRITYITLYLDLRKHTDLRCPGELSPWGQKAKMSGGREKE